MPVAVVTDSTASFSAEFARSRGITVVPLVVIINGVEGREGIEVLPAAVVEAMQARRGTVTTSRPAPADFIKVYAELLDSGAHGIASVHLAQQLSGTFDAASLAAAEVGGPVSVIDAGTTGMGLGFAVLAAASAAGSGGTLDEVRDAAIAAAARTTTLFYVDTLEFLRRGGRIGAASALVGTALSVKPILHMVDGAILVRDKVRTASRAIARLVDLAVEAAQSSDVDIAVQHVGAAERASAVLDELRDRLGERMRASYFVEAGAVVAAHVGPGFVGVVVHRHR